MTFLKRKTNLIQLLLYFMTIGYLYYFHFKLYGSVLETGFFYIVFVPPVVFFIRYLCCHPLGSTCAQDD